MKPIGTSILNLGRFVALPLVGLALAVPAIAQEDSSFLEEIVVTAQKREQNLMDVPVAITAVTGAQIEASGIKDMFDLQQNVPGLIVGQSQTATTSNFAIRGVGSTSNNFGVESSVGLYVDGVYRSRQSSIINELVDVERVEVLRGPQGTLFGKNTASGAISIRTVAPSTESNDAFMEFTAGDMNLQRISGGTNIVLSDNLAFRGTIFSSMRDGYVDNYIYNLAAGPGQPFVTVQDDIFNDRDRLGLRLQLGYDNDDDFNMRIIGDYSEIDEVCCVGISRIDALASRGELAQGNFVAGPDYARMALGGIVFTDFPWSSSLPPQVPLGPNVIEGVRFEDYITSVNYAPRSQNEDRGLSVEMNKTLANGVTLTSVTAYRAFDTSDFIDADFTDTDIITRTNDAEQHSISQELRLAGEFGESSNWVVGGYYFSQAIDSNTRTVGGSDIQDYVFLVEPDATALYQALIFASQQSGGALPLPSLPTPPGMFSDDIVKQEHDGYAVFGQVDFAISDAITLTLGGRYTDETKDINAQYTQTHSGQPALDVAGILGFLTGQSQDITPLFAVWPPNEGWGGFLFAPFAPRDPAIESISDDQFTGNAKITWFASDNAMLYASYATGFKAGGTNADRIWPFLEQVFLPETSSSVEIGFKGDLGDRLRLTLAYYQTDYEDFQAQSFTGTGFYLQNAGDMETEGFEAEFFWQALDNTTVSGYYAHNEGEFTSFERGVCWDATPFQTGLDDPGLIPPPPGSGIQPDEMPCRRTGAQIPYNPEDRFMVGITQTFPMGTNEMFFRAEYTWASEQFTDGDLDPLTLQDDLGLLNVRLGVNIDDWNSSVTLWGRNVTDERYYGGSYDVPLVTGRMNSYPSEPATWGITFQKSWD